MPRFQVFTSEWLKQGVRYTITAPNAKEAARRVLEADFPEGEHYCVKIMGQGCKKMVLDWVWDEGGNDVRPELPSAKRGEKKAKP